MGVNASTRTMTKLHHIQGFYVKTSMLEARSDGKLIVSSSVLERWERKNAWRWKGEKSDFFWNPFYRTILLYNNFFLFKIFSPFSHFHLMELRSFLTKIRIIEVWWWRMLKVHVPHSYPQFHWGGFIGSTSPMGLVKQPKNQMTRKIITWKNQWRSRPLI